MKYFRILVIWVATIALSSGLSLLLSSWIFNATLANSTVIKGWLETSGVYDGFVDEVTDSSTERIAESGQTIDAAALQTAANQAFTPDLLQSSAESILDGMYDWLDGTQQSVEFTIDFTSAKTAYSEALASQARNRVASLPACSASQIAILDTLDLFSLPCAPPEFLYQTVLTDFQQQIVTSEDFLADPVVTASDVKVPSGGESKTIENAFPAAPAIYQLFRLGVYIAFAMILVSVGILLVIAHDKLAVLRRVANSFFVAAITAGLLSIVLVYLMNMTVTTTELPDNITLVERITKPLVNVITSDILHISLAFTGVYLGIAITCYVAHKAVDKRRYQSSLT